METGSSQTIEHAGKLSAAMAAIAGLGVLTFRLARTPAKAAALAVYRMTGKTAFAREWRMIREDHEAISRIEPALSRQDVALAELKGDLGELRADVRMLVGRLIVPDIAVPDDPLGPFPAPRR